MTCVRSKSNAARAFLSAQRRFRLRTALTRVRSVASRDAPMDGPIRTYSHVEWVLVRELPEFIVCVWTRCIINDVVQNLFVFFYTIIEFSFF